MTCLDLGVAGCFHRIAEPVVEERKLALTGQVPFVLVRSYYLALTLPSRKTSFLSFFSPFYLSPPFLSLFRTLRRSRDFPLPTIRSSRPVGQSLLSYRNLFRASSIFPKTISLPPGRGNRPNADAARELSRRRSPSTIAAQRYVRTSGTFAIGNFSLPKKLIVHVGSFGTSGV